MTLVPRSSITIPPRQRSTILPRDVANLKDSILRNGLLNAPVVEVFKDEITGTEFRLIAGETRLRAIDEIAKEQKSFLHAGELIEPGSVPITAVPEQNDLSRTEMEFDENFVRTNPSWHDRARAMASIHRLRVASNPLQTIVQTAKELTDKNLPSVSGATGPASTPAIQQELYRATIVEKYLDDPSIAKARTLSEAVALVYKKEDDAAQAELIRRARSHTTTHSSVRIEQGDIFVKMKELSANLVDLLLSDPPYGVNAHRYHKGDRSSDSTMNTSGGASATNLHVYDDSPEMARKIYLEILREGFRVSKPRANLVLFIGYPHFDWLVEQSKAMGWEPWPKPLIWQKSHTEGLITGWGRNGFVLTWDCMFFARKGSRGTNYPHVDIFDFPRVSRKRRVYAAEKPVELMKRWIELTTLPGDFVLDPCAGSGSTLIAAREAKRSALGFELMQDVVDLAEVRLATTEEEFDSQEESNDA